MSLQSFSPLRGWCRSIRTGLNQDFVVVFTMLLLMFLSAFTVQLQDDEHKLHAFPSLWAQTYHSIPWRQKPFIETALLCVGTGSTAYSVPPCLFRRPSGRLEVVQLIKMMDNMVLKAGVDQQSEELTELSQVTHWPTPSLEDTRKCIAMKYAADGESAGVGADGTEHLQHRFPWGDQTGDRQLCWERAASRQTQVSSRC